MNPIQAGLLGIGTVGTGVFNVLKRNQEENKRRAERSNMGKVATLKQGRWPGSFDRLGYTTIREPGKRGNGLKHIIWITLMGLSWQYPANSAALKARFFSLVQTQPMPQAKAS